MGEVDGCNGLVVEVVCAGWRGLVVVVVVAGLLVLLLANIPPPVLEVVGSINEL